MTRDDCWPGSTEARPRKRCGTSLTHETHGRGGDSKLASQRLKQALDAVVVLNRSGALSDVRANALLLLGNTLADRL